MRACEDQEFHQLLVAHLLPERGRVSTITYLLETPPVYYARPSLEEYAPGWRSDRRKILENVSPGV